MDRNFRKGCHGNLEVPRLLGTVLHISMPLSSLFSIYVLQEFPNFADPEHKPAKVHYGFILEVSAHPPFPQPPCPITIIHGTRDMSVPIAVSRRYAQERSSVKLVEVFSHFHIMHYYSFFFFFPTCPSYPGG
jgi:pimeloyl-ACP methyl ester carboxylesterase